MDKIEIHKNLLDLQERKYRLYFTTQLIASLTVLTSILALLITTPPGSLMYSVLELSVIFAIFFVYQSFTYNKRADDAVEQIKNLLSQQPKI